MSKTKGSLDEATSQTRITWASLSSTSSPRSTWCRQGLVFIMLIGFYLYSEFIRICIFLLQAETFASNLRENLDRVRQTEAFKTYNATFQMLSASTNVTFDSRFWTKTTLNHPIISQNHSSPFNYSKLDQYYFRLFNQGWATWKSLRVLQKDSECYEPDAEHYLGDPWRNTGSTTNKHKQHNHLSMFPSIIGHKPSGIHPGGGLGSGQRLRSGNCHSCLSHLRLPSNCASHQVYEFTLPLFLNYQKYVTWSVCVGMQWKPSRFYL